MSSRLALGTVQFGVDYGVANKTGQIGIAEAHSILEYARSIGVTTLDTALAYGESEAVLGKLGVDNFDVVTKLPALPHSDVIIESWVRGTLLGSLRRLKVTKVKALMLHRPLELLSTAGGNLYLALKNLKADGFVEQIGISISDPSELDLLIPAFRFDLIQAPLNIFDRRLITSKWLAELKQTGVEVHARSTFLQGLLLMRTSDRPKYFEPWAGIFQAYDRWIEVNNLTKLEACLNGSLQVREIDRIVVGVDSLAHLQEIGNASNRVPVDVPIMLQSNDSALIDPSLWRLVN